MGVRVKGVQGLSEAQGGGGSERVVGISGSQSQMSQGEMVWGSQSQGCEGGESESEGSVGQGSGGGQDGTVRVSGGQGQWRSGFG